MSVFRVSRTAGLVVLIVLLGWALRLDDIETRSLWEDEGWTMLLSAGPGLDDVTRTLAADQHPPLFFMAFRVWRNVTGETEFATRSFSALLGLITIAAAFQLGRELFHPMAGVLGALLLALADNHIDLSQEVRHYGLLTTLVVLSSLFYARWWHHPTRANRIGYVLSSLALLYTHYLGGFVLMAQLLHMLLVVRPRQRLGEVLFLFSAIGLGFLPWLPVVIDQNRLRWDNPLYYQNALPNSADTYRAVRTALFGSHYGLMIGLALLGLVYLVYNRRVHVRLRPVWPTLYLVLWIGLMAGLTVIINARREFLTVRNFILITPALVMLIAHGLANLDRIARLFLTAVIVIVSLTTVDARRFYPDWRAVTHNITDYHLPGEPIVVDVWVGDFPVRYYIDQQMGSDTPRVSLREWRDQYKDQFLPTLLAYLQTLDAFWLVYWGDGPMTEYGNLIAEAGFQRSASLSVDHLGTPLYTYRYDRMPETTRATFDDLFALRRFSAPESAAPGDTIPVSLWWTVEQIPPLDYSVSVFVMDANGIPVAQQDGPPLNGAAPTSAWDPGSLYYDRHTLTLPATLPPGSYDMGVRVYWYGDGVPLAVDAGGPPLTDFAALGTLKVN